MSSTVPGFGAELALYQANGNYRTTAQNDGGGGIQLVVPQFCCEWHCEGLPWIGLHNCTCVTECEL